MHQPQTENHSSPTPFAQTYFHGTKADLNMGELLQVGFNSNYEQHGPLNHIYFTATLDAAMMSPTCHSASPRSRASAGSRCCAAGSEAITWFNSNVTRSITAAEANVCRLCSMMTRL